MDMDKAKAFAIKWGPVGVGAVVGVRAAGAFKLEGWKSMAAEVAGAIAGVALAVAVVKEAGAAVKA